MFDSFTTEQPWNVCLCVKAADYQMKQTNSPDTEAAMMYYEVTLAAFLQFECRFCTILRL